VEIPDGWPVHAVVRSDCVERMPPLEVIDRHMDLLRDRRAKELLVTPRGVRTVYLIDEAARSDFLLLRQPRFERLRLERDLVERLLDQLVGLADDLRQSDRMADG